MWDHVNRDHFVFWYRSYLDDIFFFSNLITFVFVYHAYLLHSGKFSVNLPFIFVNVLWWKFSPFSFLCLVIIKLYSEFWYLFSLPFSCTTESIQFHFLYLLHFEGLVTVRFSKVYMCMIMSVILFSCLALPCEGQTRPACIC